MTYVLRLFRILSLTRDGGPLPAGTTQRRRLTLLALLGLAGERGLTRERLQAYLWPESSTERARHALDQLLYATRRDLGGEVILSSASDLRLNPSVIRVDLHRFDAAIAAGQWEDAVALYDGPVLDGLHPLDSAEFEHWLDSVRARRAAEYHRALEALARDAAARGNHERSVRFWRQRAESEPLNAPVAMSLMRALAVAGDRAGAVQHARAHQALVRATLELEPDPAVEALAEQLSPPRAPPGGSPPPRAVRAVEPPVAADVLDDDIASVPIAESPKARRRPMIGLSIAALIALISVVWLVTTQEPLSATASAPAHATVANASSDRVAQAARTTTDREAERLYLAAHESWNRRTRSGLDSAVMLYRRASERDPLFAAAYAGLAQSYAMLGYFGFGPADAMFPKARSAAMRAIELDQRSGDAYAALGQVLAWEHRWRDAEAAYRRALTLSPDDPTVHQWYALTLAYEGRATEAVQHTRIASELAPLSVQINNFHGVMLRYSGDLDGSLRQFRRTVEEEPDSSWVGEDPWVLSNEGQTLSAAGRYDDAERVIRRALEMVPANPRALLNLASVYAHAGDTARARVVFARADTSNPQYPVYMAMFHATLGELDDAFQWFDRVHDWPLPTLVGLSNDPDYAPLRADPRFAGIRHRLRLDER